MKRTKETGNKKSQGKRIMNKETKISVRKLVEFILREGDLDNTRGSGVKDADAMQEGSRIHRKIQKSMPKELTINN